MKSLKYISLRVAEKLRDKGYRERFFAGQAQDEIAQQIRNLRMKRKLRQVDVANATGMKQSAVSRLEQADYSKWNFSSMLRIADALDARIRVSFEPAEEVIAHYEELESITEPSQANADFNNARNDAVNA